MELVQELSQQLGINQQQASGGLGLLLNEAKQKLGGNFGQLAQHVPEADKLIDSAPKPQATGVTPSGGMLGAVSGLLGGGGESGGLGAMSKLAGGFQQLGLSPGLLGRFVPIVLNFFERRGGTPTRGLLEQALA